MRRLWAAAAAVVVCLALAGVQAAGQDVSPSPSSNGGDIWPPTAVIHINEPDCWPHTAGSERYVNGVHQLRGWTRRCRYDDVDPRFGGPSEIVHNADCYGGDNDSCAYWGTERIPGPEGDWVGTCRGVKAGAPTEHAWQVGVLEGTGAYEGWTYVFHLDRGEEWVIDGVVYQGPPPPVPPLPLTTE